MNSSKSPLKRHTSLATLRGKDCLSCCALFGSFEQCVELRFQLGRVADLSKGTHDVSHGLNPQPNFDTALIEGKPSIQCRSLEVFARQSELVQ